MVPVTGEAENLKQAISVVAAKVQVTEVAEAVRMPWVVLEKEEASEPPVIGARRAGALPRAALPAQGGRGAAAAVHRAVAEELPEVEVAGVAAVGEYDEKQQ